LAIDVAEGLELGSSLLPVAEEQPRNGIERFYKETRKEGSEGILIRFPPFSSEAVWIISAP
jgi:hypothetical protein